MPALPNGFSWQGTMPMLGLNGELVGAPTGAEADPTKGTDVYYGTGYTGTDADPRAWEHFDPGQNPTMFLSAGDNYYNGVKGAVPGTDLYNQLQSDSRTRAKQAAAKIALLVGGGALAGNLMSGAEAAGGVGDVGGSSAFTGGIGGDAAGMLEPITVGASQVAGGTAGGFLGGLGGSEMAAFPALAGAEAGGGALASIAPSGLPSGVGGFTPAGAGMASGEVGGGAASTGFMGSIGNAVKGAFVNPDGSYNWANIIKAGGTALGAVGAYHNSQNPGTPSMPAGWNDHLAPKPLDRHVVGLGSDAAYQNYGVSGGEHQFFQPGPATQAATGGPNVHLNDPSVMNEPVMRAGGHYIKGPGTGRSDEIDAKLSNDEYVMDAETVALLGDGSPEAGAKKLDQLRANIRKHKGQQLAKGKFSSNAKAPEEYLPTMRKAKGGRIAPALKSVPTGRPVTDLDRAVQLAAVNRFRDAIKGQVKPQAPQPVMPPIEKAEGGAVKAMNAFAEALQRETANGNAARASQIKAQMEGISPGAGKFFEEGFAKGGKVSDLWSKFLHYNVPDVPRPQQLSPEDVSWMVRWLRNNQPDSDVLKHFDNTVTPDLRGVQRPPVASEDVMKILGGQE